MCSHSTEVLLLMLEGPTAGPALTLSELGTNWKKIFSILLSTENNKTGGIIVIITTVST